MEIQPTDTNVTTFFLDLAEIAAWQIDSSPARLGKIIADLPALQRGAIWKVSQTEVLWDSILRGFPIGVFTLSLKIDALLRQNFRFQKIQAIRQSGTHLLLDGQQRATAIALAFDDIWSRNEQEALGALWIDIGSRPENRDVEFVFRVLTRAHPWGYRRGNPDETLSSAAIRSALYAYQIIHSRPDLRPDGFSLWQTWPWDALAPIPAAPLISAVLANPGDIDAGCGALWQNLQSSRLISATATFPAEDDQVIKVARLNLENQRQALRQAFDSSPSSWRDNLRRIYQAFDRVLNGPRRYRVPGLTLDVRTVGAEDSDGPAAAKDAIELLFIRLNSAGTPLAGEELIYSLIKAEWPEVAEWMQNLVSRPAVPSRVAAFCVRMVLAQHSRRDVNTKATMPAMPGIREFRILMAGKNPNHPDFPGHLKYFLDNDAATLLQKAWNFLVQRKESEGIVKTDFRLLSSQAADLAQYSPDVFLLLLRWIDRLDKAKSPVAQIGEVVHRRTLGFLTALAWFAGDKARACAAIWDALEADVDEKKLIDRFNNTRFKAACRISERFEIKMIPLPTPDELQTACLRFTANDGRTCQTKEQATVHFPKGVFWTDNNWWYQQFSPLLAELMRENWHQIMVGKSDVDGQQDNVDKFEESVQQFLDSLWGGKATILTYAQRAWIQRWYPKFDPSLPDMMEDKNRPWDFDHILPQSFSDRQNMPRSVKDWCSSIGNLRAWPLEANRADGNIPPRKKFTDVSKEEKRYGIKTAQEKREASIIDDDYDWIYWKNAVPTKDEVGGTVLCDRYLSRDFAEKYNCERIYTVNAITARFVSLYRHWYDELHIVDLR